MEINDEYKKFAEDFAREAGAIIKGNFSLGMAKQWKENNTPVTETDLRINALLIKEIKKNFPTHSILGEEESHVNETSEYSWVCDPVDGTIPFSHGIPVSTFSLALTKNGESILGVVYDPFQDRLFSALKNEGAFMNGQLIQVSRADQFRGGLINYDTFAEAEYNIDNVIDHLRHVERVKLTSLASIIYASVLVAAGELVATIFADNTAHDAAAVKIIVEEANGKVTDIFGNDQRYDKPIRGFIASNGLLHDQLVKLTREFIAPGETHY